MGNGATARVRNALRSQVRGTEAVCQGRSAHGPGPAVTVTAAVQVADGQYLLGVPETPSTTTTAKCAAGPAARPARSQEHGPHGEPPR